HNVFDIINKAEEEIVKKTTIENISEVGIMYKQEYYKALMQTIEQKEDTIAKVGLNKIELVQETWNRLMQEAELRAKNIVEFAQQNKLYGKELWEGLTPKYITEMKVMSTKLKLRGRIDRVEVEDKLYTPIEIKTGNMPFNGVWLGDKIQLGAYILLLQQQHKAEHGYLEYTEYGVRKKLIMDEKLREEIINLVGDVHETVKSKYLPKKCENKKRCTNCIMREACEDIETNYINEPEQEFYEGYDLTYIP
ncbi:MAG: CRISPR-associated protein Cas4, partial [Candidatus Nanoarchaeia archaeon]